MSNRQTYHAIMKVGQTRTSLQFSRPKKTWLVTISVLALSGISRSESAWAEAPTPRPDIVDGAAFGRARAEEAAEEAAEESQNYERETSSSEFTGIPALFSSPETGVGGGGALVYLGPKLKTRRDFVLIGATFTQRQQFLNAGIIELYDDDEYVSIRTHFKLTRYPDYFFGVGNRTSPADKDLYTMRNREIGFTLRIAPKFDPKHQFGLGIHQDITEFEPFTPGGLLSRNNYKGRLGGISRNLTVRWQYQNNDDDFEPHNGTRISWDLYRATKTIGSDFENIRFWSNNATFLSLNPNTTLALQLYGQFSNGDVPWYHLAQPGGNALLRGYYLGRFRDEQMLVTQAEIRKHVFRRFGLVLFAAAGQIAPTGQELSDSTPLVAWGGGARYRLTRNQRINARLDVGFNRSEPRTPALYLYILEAF